MTFGIDISGSQNPFDYEGARDEGVEFIIVKASGFNTGELYVADCYHQHVDGARAAGLAVGHYYLVGAGDPVRQADHFVDHLHDYDPHHDVLALDNEPLDSNPVFWSQDQAFAFLARVQARTGIPWSRLWLYCPASLTRDRRPWHRITDKGIRIWWSAYGGFPTGHSPDHVPALDGSVDRWDVHQFSSKSRVAGLEIDGNSSPTTVETLFGGQTEETDVAKFTRFQDDTPIRLDEDWHRCTYSANPRRDNLAAGTGGLGLYSMVVNLYFDDFPADAQVEGTLLLEFTEGGSSPGYKFTVDGSKTHKVEAAIPANVRIATNATLHLELRKTAGDDGPLLTTWGVDVTNLTVE